MKDPYTVLGVSHYANREDVRSRYRELARTFHPDTNKAPDANERMAAINEAYEELMRRFDEKARPRVLFQARAGVVIVQLSDEWTQGRTR